MNYYGAISRTSAIIIAVILIVAVGAIAFYTTQKPTPSPTTIIQTQIQTQVVTKTLVQTQTQTRIQTQVFIRFAGWSAGETEMKNYEKIIKMFEEKNPRIKVKYEVITQMFHENIMASFGAGVAPDVFYLDSAWAPIFIEKKALLPISDYVSEDFINQYYSFLLKPFKGADGKLYGLPKDWSMLILFYNKKLFKKAGLTKPPETWEELEQYAKIITDKTGVPGLAIYLGGFNRYMPVALSNGAPEPWFSKPEDASWFDNDVVKKTMEWYINLYLKGKIGREKEGLKPYVVAPQDVGAGWLGDAFGGEKVAMVISGNWMIPFLADQYPNLKFGVDWDIASLPRGSVKRVTMAYTVALAINAKSEHPKEAVEFVKYILGPEGQKKLVVEMGHTLPSIKALAKDSAMWPEHAKSLSFIEKYDHVQIFLWGPKSGELESTISDIMASAMRGEITISKALDSMKQAVQEMLQK